MLDLKTLNFLKTEGLVDECAGRCETESCEMPGPSGPARRRLDQCQYLARVPSALCPSPGSS